VSPRTCVKTVAVASPRSTSIWNTPPLAQSLTWIFIDRPGPVRVSTSDSRELLTSTPLFNTRPRWSGILLAKTVVRRPPVISSGFGTPVNVQSRTPKVAASTVNSTYLPFTRNELGTEPAGTVTRWSPEMSSTVKPPPSHPALAAANDRSTAVIVRSAPAAAPKQKRQAAKRARAITDFRVMRDDLKPRARFNPPKAGKCDDSSIEHHACLPELLRLTKGLTVVTCERCS